MNDQVPGIEVRRARPSDVESIVAFVNPTLPSDQQIETADVIERLGVVGFLLAEKDGNLVGMAGWRAENLVAQVTDFMIWPASERLSAGRALLGAMEGLAQELLCEAVVLFLAPDCPADLLAFWETFEYLPREVTELPRAWQEAVREYQSGEEKIILKQLREDLVRRPL